MHVDTLDHVGLNVRDLERSAEWYARVLGFEILHKWTTTWMVGRPPVRLGLFLRPDAAPVENLDQRLAITHFALATDAAGFEQAQARLRELGIAFDPPEDTGIAHAFFFHDPDGHEVEITTYHA